MSRDVQAILISGAALIVATILLAFLAHIGPVDGASFIAVLLVPLLLFALLSGRLEELSGPGGWGAKFRMIVASPVGTTGLISEVVQLQLIEKSGLKSLRSIDAQLDPKQANALVLRVGSQDYSSEDIKAYLRTLKAVGTGTYVVFVYRASGNFIGSASADQVLAILDSRFAVNEFMGALQSSEQEPFKGYDFLTTRTLSATDTNKIALDSFRESGAAGLVVLADGQKPVGVVDRSRLLTKILASLSSTDLSTSA